MSYYGAEKVVAGYNVMGVAKAALEASTRYLDDLGSLKTFASMRSVPVEFRRCQREGCQTLQLC